MSTDGRSDGIAAGRLSSEQYTENFSDLHPPLSAHEAFVESDRCYFCYDAPCVTACPTGIDIPLFIRQILADNPSGAGKTIFDENILGGMCARACPTETLCEQACVRNTGEDRPVKIGELQRFATDHRMEAADHPYERAMATGKSVAVVGAGPAGLACAHRLARYGHDVTVFEAREKPGGLNEFGIATYKTVDQFAEREVDFVLGIGGITVETGKALGRDFSLADLRQRFDAVFLAMGLAGVNALTLDGEDLDGVHDAIEFIADLRQSVDFANVPVGRKVVVIGGGMTAIDAAVQSKLLGAEDVTIAYRRGQEAMNASEFEQDLAQTRGVSIKHFVQPARILGNGKVTGIELEYTQLNGGSLSGTGETFTLEADMVLKAIGQSFDGDPLEDTGDTPELERGRIKVDAERRTSLADVWAGGDCVADGEDLTVVAVQDGKVAAESIHATLAG